MRTLIVGLLLALGLLAPAMANASTHRPIGHHASHATHTFHPAHLKRYSTSRHLGSVHTHFHATTHSRKHK